MRKFILLLVLLAAMILSGCLPQTQTSLATATSPVQVKLPNASQSATVIPNIQPFATPLATVATQAAIFPDSGCTVVTTKSAAAPTATPVYPPVTSTDWVKGPANARVTLVEYSDFQ